MDAQEKTRAIIDEITAEDSGNQIYLVRTFSSDGEKFLTAVFEDYDSLEEYIERQELDVQENYASNPNEDENE